MSSVLALNRLRQLSALAAASALLTACGGGGSSSTPTPPPPPPPPASVTISGKAVDGALQGATVCYDSNDNNACDSGEPTSAQTGADGSFTLVVSSADAGQHRVIVVVPTTATDADTGPVPVPFTLVAPATGISVSQSVFVSPLTTLVARQMDGAAQSAAEATLFVQSQLGLTVSPLADFTASVSAANTIAANAARLVIETERQQSAALSAAVGQTDLSGGTVSQADVDAAVAKALSGALPTIGASAADASLTGKTGADLQAAIQALAAEVVANTGVTTQSVVVAVGIAKLPPDASPTTPVATAALAALQYTSASTWFTRINQSSALDNTPDANGLLRFVDVRTRMQPYAFQPAVGVAESFTQVNVKDRVGDLHWNGSAWSACTLGQRNTQTPRDAQGRSSYNNCDNFLKGITTRSAVDVAGQSIATVVAQKILPVVGPSSYTGGSGGSGWNVDPGVFGTAVFPAGSKLFLQSDLGTETAPAYDARSSNWVTVFSQAVADGGDARAGAVACQNAGTALATGSLEEMVSRNPGKPCIFNAQTNADGTSTSPRYSWGTTSVSLGDVPNYYDTLPAGTGNYYSNNGRMRVAFTGAGNGTTYLECRARRLDNSAQNCIVIGSGTYRVAQLGDGRVMSFDNLPAPVLRVASTRVFVERGGKVFFGFKNPVGIETLATRLNLPAAQAVMAQLNLPSVAPADAPKVLTGARAAAMATAKGVYGGADATSAIVIRFGDNGAFLLAEVDPPAGGGQPGFERGWMDFDPATTETGRLLETDSNGEWGTSHTRAGDGIASISGTALTTKGGETFNRLADSGTGIVGMWALGSATDLNATHFVFFANGKVLSIHPAETDGLCATERKGPPGIEWSDYTFDAATGALRIFNKIYDTSGCTGIFDPTAAVPNTEGNLVLTMAADKKTFTVPVDGGAVILTGYRIAPQ